LAQGLLQNPELLEKPMSTYYFVAASEAFLTEEEPLEEVLRERVRDYSEKGKEIDFWLVRQPAFLKAPEFKEQASSIPQPAAAVVSTDAVFIDFMKLRLEYVLKGSFEAPSNSIPDPLAGA
jgi:hypothetical protein